MIEIRNLYVKYIREYYALYDINLKIADGETLVILGPEHSGKTTLLRVLAKLESYKKGEIYIKDIPLKKISFANDVSMAYLPEKPIFVPNKTVYQNFQYLLKTRKISEKEREAQINQVLIDFNIEKLKDVLVEDLSQFEKYLISFIRFTFRDIEIALIDNIFDKLNQEECEFMLKLIKEMFVKQKITTILATTKNEIAEELNAKTITLDNGSIKE